jgi:hypothetical protein
MTYCSIKFAFVSAAIAVMLAAPMQTASAKDPTSSPPLAAASPSPDASPASTPSMKVACGPDLASFCADLKGKEARKCLQAHRKELSPSCAAYFTARRAAAKAKANGATPPGSPPPAAPPQQ